MDDQLRTPSPGWGSGSRTPSPASRTPSPSARHRTPSPPFREHKTHSVIRPHSSKPKKQINSTEDEVPVRHMPNISIRNGQHIHWLHVGTLASGMEKKVDGFVWQADTSGIKVAWDADDHQSGIVGYRLAVGTTKGGSDVMDWTQYKSETDVYISDLSLPLTDIVTKSPVYYVSLIGDNGAGQESTIITSTPIVVVNEDKPGIVIDGAEGTDNLDLLILDDDTDYQLHPTVVTVQFDGFESHLHGVMEYKWAVGTTPGGEDVMSFIPYGLIHSEEVSVKGNGITSSGYAQANLDLKSGVTYYSTVRAITNVGSVLESVSDGFTVDTSPPIISLDRLTDKSSTDTNIGAGSTLYEKSADTLFASWHYNDTESSIRRAWYSVGTYPFAEDVSPITEVEVSSGLHSVLPLASVIPDTTGKPNIISIWAENNAGTINKLTSGSVIIDTTPPSQGVVTCPKFVGAKVPVKCSWSGFQDRESPIQRFLISLGSEEGLTDIFVDKKVSGFTSSFSIDGDNNRINKKAASLLSIGIKQNTGLESLILNLNPMGDEGMESIINMVKLQLTLNYVSLEEMNLSPANYHRILDLQSERDISILHGGSGGYQRYTSQTSVMRLFTKFLREHRPDIETAFLQQDKDHSGNLSSEDLKMALKTAGLRLTNKQLGILLEDIDMNHSGEIKYKDILSGTALVGKRKSSQVYTLAGLESKIHVLSNRGKEIGVS
ncbi:unnamed protein product [Mytilus edulis]|uniref:EF-hand domain-containing protein n=1 Tax=Mytilus edulis TaxID=6550 RepID=A0A8S3Q8A9_MYTED|nr:unnamed protein product [Mytilus edulis]